MEWVDGTRLVDGAELAVYTGDDRAGTRLVDALVQCSLRQMLDSGFFHADPHAGNLLATDDGRLCYLDFGMMSYLEERQRVPTYEVCVWTITDPMRHVDLAIPPPPLLGCRRPSSRRSGTWPLSARERAASCSCAGAGLSSCHRKH